MGIGLASYGIGPVGCGVGLAGFRVGPAGCGVGPAGCRVGPAGCGDLGFGTALGLGLGLRGPAGLGTRQKNYFLFKASLMKILYV